MWYLAGAFVLFFLFYRLSQSESSDPLVKETGPKEYWKQPRGLARYVVFSWNMRELDPESSLENYRKFFKELPGHFPEKTIFLEIEANDFFHNEKWTELFMELVDLDYIVDLADSSAKDLKAIVGRRVLLNGLSLTLEFKNSHELYEELYQLGEDGEFTAKILLEEKDVEEAREFALKWKTEGLNGAITFAPKDNKIFSPQVIDFLVDYDKVKSAYDLTDEERELIPRPYMESETGEKRKPSQMEGMSFKGWHCYAGIERLFMDSTGEIFRSACHQGIGLGNVHDQWRMESQPLICEATSCHDYFDLMTTKELRS